MKIPKIVHCGLSRVQLQTLKCHFPTTCEFLQINADFFVSEENIKLLVSNEGCVFINPRKLSASHLQSVLQMHQYAQKNSHATIMLFSNPFTEEQQKCIETKRLHRVNLIRGRDPELLKVVKLIRKATTPCSENLDDMCSNMFNDGWYLIDFETTGFDSLTDEIVSFSISYMTDYNVQNTTTYYIKQKKRITTDVEEWTGITNEMLENGIEKTELIDVLNNLPSPSPFILYSESYFVPFLKALYMSCGENFKTPYIALDELAAHVFGHISYKKLYDILSEFASRKYDQSNIEHDYLQKLYDATLAVFESLQERYQIRSMGELSKIYLTEDL